MSGKIMGGVVKANTFNLSMRNSHYNPAPKNLYNPYYLTNWVFFKTHLTRFPLYFGFAYAWASIFDPIWEQVAEYNQGTNFCQREMWNAVERRTIARMAEEGEEEE